MNTKHQFSQRLVLVSLCFSAFFSCKNETENGQSANLTQGGNPVIEALTAKIQSDAANDSLYYLRAEAFYQEEGYDEAIADLNRALAIDSLNPYYHHLLADVYLDYFKSYPAIQTMEKAVRLFPDRIPTLLKMSEFYLIVQKHSEALKTIDDIFQRDPQHPEAFFMTGMVAKDMGDTTRAIKAFERSVSIEPGNYDAWIILGNLLAEQNSPVCLRYYDNAIRVDSLNTIAYDAKATFYHKKGQFAKAMDIYKEIVQLEPQRAETYFDMGLMYIEIDSFQTAKEHFDLTVNNNPLFFKAFYYRGIAEEAMGNLEAAAQDYKQASKMVSGFTEAEEALKRVQNTLGQ